MNAEQSPWTGKLLAFALPSVVGSALSWFLVQQALRGHVNFTALPWLTALLFSLFGLAALALWISPILLLNYLSPRIVRYSVAVVITIPMLVFFPMHIWTWVAVTVMVIGIGWGNELMANRVHDQLSIKPQRTFPTAVPMIVLCILLAISVLYYQQIRAGRETADELSQHLIDQTTTLTEKAMPLIYKNYSSDMTVDELLGAQLPTADSIFSDIQFDSLNTQTQKQQALEQKLVAIGLTPSEVNIDLKKNEADIRRQIDERIAQYRKQTIDQARKELGARFNVVLKGDETMHKVLTDIVGRQYNQHFQRYATVVPIVLAAALFFLLRIGTSLFQAIIVWGGWLFLKIYRWLRVLTITHQTVPAEKMEWGS